MWLYFLRGFLFLQRITIITFTLSYFLRYDFYCNYYHQILFLQFRSLKSRNLVKSQHSPLSDFLSMISIGLFEYEICSKGIFDDVNVWNIYGNSMCLCFYREWKGKKVWITKVIAAGETWGSKEQHPKWNSKRVLGKLSLMRAKRAFFLNPIYFYFTSTLVLF